MSSNSGCGGVAGLIFAILGASVIISCVDGWDIVMWIFVILGIGAGLMVASGE
jgi:hypothetical protein